MCVIEAMYIYKRQKANERDILYLSEKKFKEESNNEWLRLTVQVRESASTRVLVSVGVWISLRVLVCVLESYSAKSESAR